MGREPQLHEVRIEFAREHRFEIEFEEGLPRKRVAVAKQAQSQTVRHNGPQMFVGAIEKLLRQPVRIDAGGSPDAGRPAVEVDVAADEMNGNGPEKAIDRIGPTADFGPRAGRQRAEAELPQQRQGPPVVGNGRSRFAFGEALGRIPEFRPVPEKPVPGGRDRFVDAVARAAARSPRHGGRARLRR